MGLFPHKAGYLVTYMLIQICAPFPHLLTGEHHVLCPYLYLAGSVQCSDGAWACTSQPLLGFVGVASLVIYRLQHLLSVWISTQWFQSRRWTGYLSSTQCTDIFDMHLSLQPLLNKPHRSLQREKGTAQLTTKIDGQAAAPHVHHWLLMMSGESPGDLSTSYPGGAGRGETILTYRLSVVCRAHILVHQIPLPHRWQAGRRGKNLFSSLTRCPGSQPSLSGAELPPGTKPSKAGLSGETQKWLKGHGGILWEQGSKRASNHALVCTGRRCAHWMLDREEAGAARSSVMSL